MKRRTAREKALQALFQIDMSEADPKEAILHVLEEERGDDYLSNLVSGVVEHKSQIDEMIKEHLEKWTIERIAPVDRNLLRLAVYELVYLKEEVPSTVVIDEAIEIAKVFGDEHASRFVNGVLSKIKQQTEKQ